LIEEGVQKVFGTLDLFVSLLETEIKYPILQGGILPFWTPSLSSVSLPAGEESNKEAFRFPYHGNSPPMLPGGLSARYLRFAYHSIPGFPRG